MLEIHSYLVFGLALLAAECIRRLVLMLKLAYTGPLSKIPGPWWGKVSAVPWMISNVTGNSMNQIPGYFEEYGHVIRVAPNDILFAGKEAIQKILVEEDLVKAPVYEDILMYPGVTNLITERDKALYKAKRRLLSPGFSISYLNGMEPQIQACMRDFEAFLNAECETGDGFATVDMSRMLSSLTFDSMSATSFGGSFKLVASGDTKLKNIFLDRLKRDVIDSQSPPLKYIPFTPPSMSEEFNAMIDRIIAARRDEMKGKSSGKKDLLQMFIDTHDADPTAFSELHMREEMALFILAGSDTSSTTLTFTLFLLVEHIEKLERLRKEIDEAFPDKDGEITFVGTQDLVYLNAVINESMRVLPIVTIALARTTTETTTISGYEIPPNTLVSTALSQLMHNPSLFPDPDLFLRERWLSPYKGLTIDRKAHLPFSAGSRSCIGQQFAMKELRLILATLVRRYELVEVKGQSKETRVHTVPWLTQGGYRVGVRRRVSC